MNTNDFFSKKLCFEKSENFNGFSKGNEMKGSNNNALLSGRDRHTAKNYITTLILPLIPLFFSVLNGFFKNMCNFQFIDFEIRSE